MWTCFSKMAVIGFCSILAVGATASWVSAHSGATGVTKERMELMKDMADAMKTMGAMFKGEAPFDPAIIAEKAGFLAGHATTIPQMTPDGSAGHPSEALPIIWQEWDGYRASAEDFGEESARLAAIAGDGADEIDMRAQYVRVGKTCGSCHDRFRKPKG